MAGCAYAGICSSGASSYGKNRVARLLREQGLGPRQKRRFRPCTTQSRHTHQVAENWLTKVPAPDRLGRVRQSDITYIETAEGWLYLPSTLTGVRAGVVAHHCREDLLGELTTTNFDLAATRQRPAVGLIHHGDRCSQYAAVAFRRRLDRWRVTSSMRSKANPYDNALAESFVATLITECFAEGLLPTKAAAKLMIFDFIETFYNTRRRHSAVGYRLPAQFEKQTDRLCSQGEGCSGGAAKAARPASKQVGSSVTVTFDTVVRLRCTANPPMAPHTGAVASWPRSLELTVCARPESGPRPDCSPTGGATT
jgi:putative transposase